MTALGIIPCCIENVAKSYYQGTGRIPQMAVISVLEGFLFPALAAWLLSALGGPDSIWLYFAAGQTATVLFVFVYGLIQYRQGKNPILQSSFGVAPENAMEARIASIEEALDASRRAEAFCTEHSGSGSFAKRIALCIEEMAGNTVLHGFRPGKKNHLSVRVQCKNNQWILRFRDDCGAFDPVHYIPPENGRDALGIRLVLGMADDVRYTHSLNLNNLTILLNESRAVS
jgi:anti-sigma regulatory factor (Ser/Thr protein kinase)